MCKTLAISDSLDSPDKAVPPRADADDNARFKKARDYMIRVDDSVTCSRCWRRIEINSKSVVLL